METLSDDITAIGQEFEEIVWALDERRIRLWCAARANAYNRQHGRGGVMAVHKATGVSRPRIVAGVRELQHPVPLSKERVRHPGGGRKKRLKRIQGFFRPEKGWLSRTPEGIRHRPFDGRAKVRFAFKRRFRLKGILSVSPRLASY